MRVLVVVLGVAAPLDPLVGGVPVDELAVRSNDPVDLGLGDEVTVFGYKAKDGSNNMSSRQVTLPDGRKVFSGSADDRGPK